jgi:bifunctional non-homologous end joining protein LigD
MSLSFPVLPMKAAMGSLPPAGDDGNWAYEIKWDGYRTLLFVDANARRVRVQSSSGLDVSATYPELSTAYEGANATKLILDGEIVVFDETGRPSFEGVQRHTTQVVFQAFDVLSVDGHDVIGIPYEQRRELLANVLEPGSNWTVPAHRLGGGDELLAATAAQGLEGVIAKRLGSTYQPGKRSPNWRKVKNRTRVDVVIGGYTGGTGNRSSTFGALLVGRRDEAGVLRFAGGVGTGFTQRRLDELVARFRTLHTAVCPFEPEPPREYSRDARWISPVLTASIEIAEFTNEGYVRHASFIELAESLES